MTHVEIASEALAGITAVERAGGEDAFHLCQTLRLVVAAYLTTGAFPEVRDSVEVAASKYGMQPLTEHDLVDLRYRGLDRLQDPIIERARRDIREAQRRQELTRI